MLLDLIRRVVPIKYRQSIGLWTAHQAGRSKLLLYPYMYLLCKAIPKNLDLLPGDTCRVTYKSHRLTFPRDGIFTSWEVLQDRVYEKYHSPQDGDTVLDIGAYVGMFTVLSSLLVGSTGSVIAIEPASANLLFLRHNTEALSNVTIVHTAAGLCKGTARLVTSKASPCYMLAQGDQNHTEPVDLDTVDNIAHRLGLKKVDFIKIDAEGAELAILQGATKTLRYNKVRLSVAAYHRLPTGEYELPIIRHLLTTLGFKTKTWKEYIYAEK